MVEFSVRCRKFKNNPLLARKQFVLDIIHPGKASVSKKDLASKLAQMYKVRELDTIQIFGLKCAFGGGRSSGFALIYNDMKSCKAFEPAYRLTRAGLGGAKKGTGRRGKKDVKNRVKKTRGKDKTKAKKGAGK